MLVSGARTRTSLDGPIDMEVESFLAVGIHSWALNYWFWSFSFDFYFPAGSVWGLCEATGWGENHTPSLSGC